MVHNVSGDGPGRGTAAAHENRAAGKPPETRSGQRSASGRRLRHVTARAVGLAPCGGRLRWAWIVARCPFCSGSHLHRGGRDGGIRRAGCGRGEYRVTAGRWSR